MIIAWKIAVRYSVLLRVTAGLTFLDTASDREPVSGLRTLKTFKQIYQRTPLENADGRGMRADRVSPAQRTTG